MALYGMWMKRIIEKNHPKSVRKIEIGTSRISYRQKSVHLNAKTASLRNSTID